MLKKHIWHNEDIFHFISSVGLHHSENRTSQKVIHNQRKYVGCPSAGVSKELLPKAQNETTPISLRMKRLLEERLQVRELFYESIKYKRALPLASIYDHE